MRSQFHLARKHLSHLPLAVTRAYCPIAALHKHFPLAFVPGSGSTRGVHVSYVLMTCFKSRVITGHVSENGISSFSPFLRVEIWDRGPLCCFKSSLPLMNLLKDSVLLLHICSVPASCENLLLCFSSTFLLTKSNSAIGGDLAEVQS